MAKITRIEGIGEEFARKLRELGITSTEALLEKGANPNGREEIAEEAGISQELILRWINQADLLRIKGVGGQYADLLESAGVDSVAELARRRAENLVQQIAELNESRELVRRLPAQSHVTDWIEQARKLPRLVGDLGSQAAEFRGANFSEMPSPEEAMPGEAAMEALPGNGGTDNIP